MVFDAIFNNNFQLYRDGQFYMWRKQLYVIKFDNDLQQVCGFHRVLQFPPHIKLTITIQLKIIDASENSTKIATEKALNLLQKRH
jgi:hypothetical protein